MEYYDKNNNKVIISDEILEDYLNNGACGTVYRYGKDLCLKIYRQEHLEPKHKLEVSIYNALKEIDSPNLIDIIELYFKEKRQTHYNADAFLSRYYKEKYTDFLEIPTTYLLENIEQILKLSNELSKRKIRLFDLKRENIILAEQNIIFIDPDMWYHSHLNEYEIKGLNINILSSFFNEITKESLKTNHQKFMNENGLYYDQISDKLFPLTSSEKRHVKTLTKRLTGYERPIDYVYSRKK